MPQALAPDNEVHGKQGIGAALGRAAGGSHVVAVADATVGCPMAAKAAGSQNARAGHLRNNLLEVLAAVVFVATWSADDGDVVVVVVVAVAVAVVVAGGTRCGGVGVVVYVV